MPGATASCGSVMNTGGKIRVDAWFQLDGAAKVNARFSAGRQVTSTRCLCVLPLQLHGLIQSNVNSYQYCRLLVISITNCIDQKQFVLGLPFYIRYAVEVAIVTLIPS